MAGTVPAIDLDDCCPRIHAFSQGGNAMGGRGLRPSSASSSTGFTERIEQLANGTRNYGVF